MHETEYWKDDFEKKLVGTSRLLKQVQCQAKATEVLVFSQWRVYRGIFSSRFEQCNLEWTGRIKKKMLVTYAGKKASYKNNSQH